MPKGLLFDHVAIAIPRMADAPAVLAGVLGGVPVQGATRNGFTWAVWRFAGGGDLEILEPAAPDSFVHRFLAARGPGVHHVTFKVESLDAACERADRHGYAIVGRDDSDPAWREAFLHPRQALGIVVQFAEEHAPPGSPRWQPPPGPADPPSPVRLVGVRMRARSRDAARRQWEDVLRGRPQPSAGGALVYRWAGSPMRVVVDVDPSADDGPVAIEYAAHREVTLPAGPHPVLGVPFIRVSFDS